MGPTETAITTILILIAGVGMIVLLIEFAATLAGKLQ